MKYVLIIGITVAIGLSAFLAYSLKTPTPVDDNFRDGVQAVEPLIPAPTNYVNDLNDSLAGQTEDVLNATLSDLSETGVAQVAVLVLDSTSPLGIEEYGIKLADQWQVGEAGKDNGVILILATKDRRVRIEVGKGAEGVIPDAVAGRIIDELMVPSLKVDAWDVAVLDGVGEIINRLKLNNNE